MKLGRNDPCHCGSGKKYKKCHEQTDAAAKSAEFAAQAVQRQAAIDKEKEEADDKAKKDGVAARPAAEGAGAKRPAVSAPKPAPLRRRFV